MHAVIIKGNPKFINNAVAQKYYADIEYFLKDLGYTVEFDAGADYTRPRQDADLYVGHSRGTGRYDFMDKRAKPKFLKFGSYDGIIHPVDAAWQAVTPPGTGTPPIEHFIFTDEQKAAIMEKSIDRIPAELRDLFRKALKDKFLGPSALSHSLQNIVPLKLKGKVVGFAIPFQEVDGVWRTGSIYVDPAYRGSGAAANFIREFKEGKKVRAWIEPDNKSSIRAFTAAGYLKTGKSLNVKGKKFDEYSSEVGNKVFSW